IRDYKVTGVRTCALPIFRRIPAADRRRHARLLPVGDGAGDQPQEFAELGVAYSLMNLDDWRSSTQMTSAMWRFCSTSSRCRRTKIGRASCRESMESVAGG